MGIFGNVEKCREDLDAITPAVKSIDAKLDTVIAGQGSADADRKAMIALLTRIANVIDPPPDPTKPVSMVVTEAK